MTETYLQKLQREHKERRARLNPLPPPSAKPLSANTVAPVEHPEKTDEELEDIVFRGEVDFHSIFKEVCKFYGVSMLDVISPRRQMKMVMARHVTAHIAIQHTKVNTRQLASLLARDHSTIVYALQRMEKLSENESIATDIGTIKKRLGL